MKKLLLSVYLLSMVAFVGYSQSLLLTHDGTPVLNGEEVTYHGLPSDPEVVAEMDITNNSGVSLDILVKKVEIDLVIGSTNTFCWGLCFPPNIYISPEIIAIAAGATNTIDFSGHYYPNGFAGSSIIRYVMFNALDPNDSVCFNARYDVVVGLDDPNSESTLSNVYPNPANMKATFNYTVEAGAKAELLIRNVLGSTIRKIELAGDGQARISTSELSEGIYFYSLMVNGRIQSTRKLVVAH